MTEDIAQQSLAQIMRALKFAAAKHRDQRRKDVQASPYINHPIALAVILADEVGVTDTAVICAALLHDTVEDTETTIDELVERFGAEVASIVAEVTDDKTLPKSERKKQQIEHARTASEKARLVKLADKIANLRDIATSPPADWILRVGKNISIGQREWWTRCVERTPSSNRSSMWRHSTGNSSRLRSLIESPCCRCGLTTR